MKKILILVLILMLYFESNSQSKTNINKDTLANNKVCLLYKLKDLSSVKTLIFLKNSPIKNDINNVKKTPFKFVTLSNVDSPHISVVDTFFLTEVKTKNKTFKFEDKFSFGEYDSVYRYLGQDKSTKYYFLERNLYEKHDILMIDYMNNKIDTIWTLPVFSPNYKYLYSNSIEFGMAETPQGFQIYKISNHIHKIYEISNLDNIPMDIVWLNDNNAIIRCLEVDNYYKELKKDEKQRDYKYLKLIIK